MRRLLTSCLLAAASVLQSSAYQLMISDQDETRQVCSGMWGTGGTREPYIEVVFSPASTGAVALVIYEWQDAKYLGIDRDGTGAGENEWKDKRIYVCTLAANRANLCTTEQLGQFIVSTPVSITANSTSIYTTSVRFSRDMEQGSEQTTNSGPFRYSVTKTGYYCVGAVPVTFGQTEDDSPVNPDDYLDTVYTGVVDFENTFEGHLPATEYPKIWFYLCLAFLYTIFGIVWGIACYRNKEDISPLQHYVSMTIAFLVVEMFAVWNYYRYLNVNGARGWSKVWLIIVAVLNAGRNSISFFLLAIVCMGFGVVRPSLGPLMIRVRALAIIHFIFGILFSVGTVTIPLEKAGYLILLAVFPLAFTLTAFMMWIMWSLNATITDLSMRKQTYKKNMFVKLYRVLIGAVIVIAAFFVISSISFSNRLDEDYAPDTWKTRWWLLDGWLSILYLAVFAAIAYLWRPSPNNRRLAMSDELATDENEANDDVDLDDLEAGKDDYKTVNDDDVVFDIGDEGSDDGRSPQISKTKDISGTREDGDDSPLRSPRHSDGRLSDDEKRKPLYSSSRD